MTLPGVILARALLVLAAAANVPLAAQDGSAFRAAYELFLTADTAAPVLAVRASDLFLALPPGPERTAHVAAGVHATLAAGRSELAADLAAAARGHGNAEPLLVQSHLQALVRADRFDAFVELARADAARDPAPVAAALRAEESRLGPRAERALRHGDGARGRFVFEQLAALQPPQSWRTANLALCLRQLGDVEAARALYAAAVRTWPDDLELGNDFGLFLRAVGDVVGAVEQFRRSHTLDLARAPGQRGRGPAITNLLHLEATRPGVLGDDPLPAANAALALRPDALMLRRLALDVALDRLATKH